MDFCKQFNARTQDQAGKIIPVIIQVYGDKSFDFITKQPPVAIQLLEAAKLKSGSAEPNRKKVASLSWDKEKENAAGMYAMEKTIDLVTDNSLTTAERAQYKAEAKIFRAMVMFDMVRLWGDFPVITTVAYDITSENIDEVYPQYFPKQNTELEAYQQIEKDL